MMLLGVVIGPNLLVMEVIGWIIQALTMLILIDAILTWFPQVSHSHPAVVMLRQITAPIYRPIRRLIPPEKTGYIDLSPAIAILGLYVIGTILKSILIG